MSSKQIRKLKEMVRDILENDPESRNSDTYLMIAVWKRFYPQYIHNGRIYLDTLTYVPSQDDVSRCRRAYQQEGLYLPTREEVAKARGMNIEEWKKALGYTPAYKQDLF